METELIFAKEVYEIIGAAIEVHKTLGHGFLEAIYQEALEYELAARNIPFSSQVELKVKYKNQKDRRNLGSYSKKGPMTLGLPVQNRALRMCSRFPM